jgi:hypothetical protein
MPARRPARLSVEPLDDRLTPNAYQELYDTTLPDSLATGAAVAAFADGGFVTVTNVYNDLVARRFDGVRREVGEPITLPRPPSADRSAGIAGAAASPLSDDWVAVWVEPPPRVVGEGVSGVYFARYRGRTLLTSGAVGFGAGTQNASPAVAMSGDGSFVIAFGNAGAIDYRAFRPDGTALGVGTVPGTAGVVGGATVAVERTPVGAGRTVAVGWNERPVTGGETRPRLSTFDLDATGGPLPLATAVDVAGAAGDGLKLDIDDAGFVGAAWATPDGGLRYRVFEPDTAAPSTGAIPLPAAGTASAPALAVGPSAFSRYVVTYIDASSPNARVQYVAETGTDGLDAGPIAGSAFRPAFRQAVDMAGGAWAAVYGDTAAGVTRVSAWGYADGRYGSDVAGARSSGDIVLTEFAPAPDRLPDRERLVGYPQGGGSPQRYALAGRFSARVADGRQYVTLYGGEGGLGDQRRGIWILSSPGGGFLPYTVWSNADYQEILAGDVDGNGTDDLIGRKDGDWYVSREVDGVERTTRFARWSNGVVYTDGVVGDFNGDGMTDVAAREAGKGTWWVGLSNGSSFDTAAWTTWNPAPGWRDVRVGDFDGDGKDDIAGRTADAGEIWVAGSTGTGFADYRLAVWSNDVTWVGVSVADFDGDGRDDLAGMASQFGTWYVTAANAAGGTDTRLWATWRVQPLTAGVTVRYDQFQVGDFNRDGRPDVMAELNEFGSATPPLWFANLSAGSAFVPTLWGTPTAFRFVRTV